MNTIIKRTLILALVILPIYSFAQDEMIGLYSYDFAKGAYFYSESIELYPNGDFNYKMRRHMGGKVNINGKWHRKDSCLVLNSYPQKEKLVVRESFTKKTQKRVFNVVEETSVYSPYYQLNIISENDDTLNLSVRSRQIKNKKEKIETYFRGGDKPLRTIFTPFSYHLFIILENGDTLALRNQYQHTKIKNKKIKAFWIVDNKGLKSPLYTIKLNTTNVFDIVFETNRIFKDEDWLIIDQRIKPRRLDGEFASYYLTKD